MKKILIPVLLLAPLIGYGANQYDVRINEFMPHPESGTSWVELINSSGSNLDLAGWQIIHLAVNEFGSTTTATTTLPSLMIPAEGLASFDLSLVGTTSDEIILFDDLGQLIHGVTYGDIHLPSTDYFDIVPALGQSAVTSGNAGGFWSLTSSTTRNWFNQSPTKQEVINSLPAGVTTNLNELDDWTSVSNVSFSRAGYGGIAWSGPFNLTGSSDRAAFQNINLDTGYIKFNGLANSVLASSSAQVTMFDLPFENYTANDLIVYDNSGNLIDTSSPDCPVITDFSYTFGNASGTLVFTTSHFTAFAVPTTTPVIVEPVTPPTGGGSHGGGGSGGSVILPATTTPVVGRILGAQSFRFTRILRPGMSGVDVRELQKILQKGGFLKIKTATKYFGSVTQKALIAWKKKNKIRPPTGVVSKSNLEYLSGLGN